MFNINKSISDLENFAILSPVSDNLDYPNYKIDKKKMRQQTKMLLKMLRRLTVIQWLLIKALHLLKPLIMKFSPILKETPDCFSSAYF